VHQNKSIKSGPNKFLFVSLDLGCNSTAINDNGKHCSYMIPDIDVTEDLKKREVEKYEQAMKAERQHLEIVGPDDI